MLLLVHVLANGKKLPYIIHWYMGQQANTSSFISHRNCYLGNILLFKCQLPKKKMNLFLIFNFTKIHHHAELKVYIKHELTSHCLLIDYHLYSSIDHLAMQQVWPGQLQPILYFFHHNNGCQHPYQVKLQNSSLVIITVLCINV